jgi:hypothetical protein
MFGKVEMERLRAQKSLLVLQSEINRLQLAADWQKIRSPKNWVNSMGGIARHFPILTAVLSTVTGALAVKALRRRGMIMDGIGRLTKLASLALAGWKLFGNKNPKR